MAAFPFTTDSSLNVYIGGEFTGVVNNGGATITANAVAKISPDGVFNYLSTNTIVGSIIANGTIALDLSNNLFFALYNNVNATAIYKYSVSSNNYFTIGTTNGGYYTVYKSPNSNVLYFTSNFTLINSIPINGIASYS